PFRFVKSEFQPGVKAVYEKNIEYRPRAEKPSWVAGAKIVKVDRVEWVVIADPQTAANALAKGEVDFFEQPAFDLLPQLKKAQGVLVKDHNKLGNGAWLRINWLQPPFDNVKIRQAILHAVNQEDYLAAQIGDPDFYRTCGGFFPCGTPFGFEDGAPQIAKQANLEKAKQLLKDGGYKGEKIVVMSPEDLKSLTPLGPVTAQALRKIGMNVELQSIDWASVIVRRAKKDNIDNGGWHIFHTFWVGADLLNPINNAGINTKGDGAWFGWPKDEEIEKLRDRFARETDPNKQKEIAYMIHKRAYEIVVYVPTGQYQWPYAYRSNLVGVLDAPAPVFWNMEKR
ncbi:MAG: ABC transporter substrate-binding protein, partial [Alphaproteobacteria bacterium]